MHKQIVNELRLDFVIEPQGPISIKSGRAAGADPTLLDMNFVRTDHGDLGTTVYLPGSSLKGVLRSHAERIARTLGLRCCDPLGDGSCGRRLEGREGLSSPQKYAELCTICRLFGHTVQASHLCISDAYPQTPILRTERRDGVAIDRVSGAVAGGPFSLEVVTEGRFATQLSLHNFQLWQVGLLAIALRDLERGRVPIGFGKSRGLGRVTVLYEGLEVSYPGHFEAADDYDFAHKIYGVAAFPMVDKDGYDFEAGDVLDLPAERAVEYDWGTASLVYTDSDEIVAFLRATVSAWQSYAENPGRKGGD